MSDSESGGEHTNTEYHPPPKKDARKVVKPKKAKPKKPVVEIITDFKEWERLLRDVPLESGHIRFFIGKGFKTRFD
jgi:hypothetical protein